MSVLFAAVAALLFFCQTPEARAQNVNANFNSAGDVPVTANGYTASGKSVSLALNFPPITGTELTVVRNTSQNYIVGQFSNLAHGQFVSLSFNGTSYGFVANYYGGSGNDLVLVWAKNRAYAWGTSGIGAHSARQLPVAVTATGVLTNKTLFAVTAGFGHSLALASDGTLAAWGRNSEGQLGVGTTNPEFTPVAVDAGSGSALFGKKVVAVAAGVHHTLALCSDGTVAAWGGNTYGQLGDATTTQRTRPVLVNQNSGSALFGKTVIAIKAGAHHSLALCSDGTLASWGLNANAQLGDNTTNNRSFPVTVVRTGASALAGKTPVALAAGNYHSMALCSDGTLAAWGNNTYGQLGHWDPVTLSFEAIMVTKEFFPGSTYSLFGQKAGLGVEVPGTLTTYTEISERRIPGRVRTDQGLSALYNKTVTSINAGTSHSMALCSDGTVVAWGKNTDGQVGNGATTDQKVPTAVAVASPSALQGKFVTAIGSGRDFSTAVLTDGTAAAWGGNKYGQIGDDTNTGRLLPAAVGMVTLAPGERFIQISSAAETVHSVAIVAMPLLPSMTVTGNGTSIANGASQPSAANHTDFGLTQVGGSTARTFTIQNGGPGPLNITGTPRVTISGGSSMGFTVTQQPASPVASGGTTTFEIAYSPTFVGQRSAAIVTISNDDLTKNPFTFVIEGTAPTPNMSVSGNGVNLFNGSSSVSLANHTDFGFSAVGSPVSRTFTIQNTGLGDLNLTGNPKVTLSGAGAGGFSVSQQPASPVANGGGSTTFQITFTPTSVGQRSSATVSIANNDSTKSPFTFAIAGAGPVPSMNMLGNGAAIQTGSTEPTAANHTDFGTTLIGSTVTRTFTIQNSGLGALTLTGNPRVAISGADAGDFSVTQQPGSEERRGGKECRSRWSQSH